MPGLNVAVIGASGGLGSAFVHLLSQKVGVKIIALSRSAVDFNLPCVRSHQIDFNDEETLRNAAEIAIESGPLDLVIVATGLLHNSSVMPEKSIHDLSEKKFQKLFMANTIGPALVAKHFLPKLHRNKRAVFAALSARVGSIEDNQLGGWYAYRASKAALNMIIKTASIEMARRQKLTIVVCLHPGTVASKLSEPFQRNVPNNKLFNPDFAAAKLMNVIDKITTADSGKVFAWDGSEIPY